MTKSELGKRIRAARLEKGISQVELAAQLESLPSQICDWEHGRREPTGRKMLLLVSILGLDIPKTIPVCPKIRRNKTEDQPVQAVGAE